MATFTLGYGQLDNQIVLTNTGVTTLYYTFQQLKADGSGWENTTSVEGINYTNSALFALNAGQVLTQTWSTDNLYQVYISDTNVVGAATIYTFMLWSTMKACLRNITRDLLCDQKDCDQYALILKIRKYMKIQVISNTILYFWNNLVQYQSINTAQVVPNQDLLNYSNWKTQLNLLCTECGANLEDCGCKDDGLNNNTYYPRADGLRCLDC